MFFPRRPSSPPPPSRSPNLVPVSLPSPPHFSNKLSKSPSAAKMPLPDSGPTPLSPIGVRLIQLRTTRSQDRLRSKPKASTLSPNAQPSEREGRIPRKSVSTSNLKLSPSSARTRRVPSLSPSRCRSPPPSPSIASPPPPVPPIPAFLRNVTEKRTAIPPTRSPRPSPRHSSSACSNNTILDLYLNRDEPLEACKQGSQAGAVTCMQFFAIHNPEYEVKA
ncbi:hypothetical protein CONPUDRAFT_164735 [Coniophora puteana RWD-64-598 SS2]|uniref:Uncharacterized protein n=1 Tax=Coniophora puteana (strain RWD-64-598) TaxID=741705 RepID=A0A5M3MSE8_CONPW|nr:uncharacterized protein CONPUDRAFT_164735 [Coniophora puteana RWD-64-598 SS2]EIW82088.1 hypothetical protein CONPUDRAFT_164735 [Coniophora puteana RWD-64-598 SS2]